MIKFEIPGFGDCEIKYLVSDFTGTLSVDGRLIAGLEEKLLIISELLDVHVVTADTFGTVKEALKNISCGITIITGKNQDVQKGEFVKNLGQEGVIALGNGNNDRIMLKTAKIGIAVMLEEGCSVSALTSGDAAVKSPVDALDLILNHKRLKATLRF